MVEVASDVDLDVIAKTKRVADVQALIKENESLMRNLEQANEQNREQQEALKANIKTLFQSNTELQAELDQYKEKEKVLVYC
jgi:hypothetical protein